MKKKKKPETVEELAYEAIDAFNDSIKFLNDKTKSGITIEEYMWELTKRLTCCFKMLLSICTAMGLKGRK